MPGRDRTGPMGQGPMTGRGYGYCAGRHAGAPALPRQWRAFGMNRRGGDGSCRAVGRHGWGNPHTAAKGPLRMRASRWRVPDEGPVDKEALRQHIQALQSEIAEMSKQLDELEKGI